MPYRLMRQSIDRRRLEYLAGGSWGRMLALAGYQLGLRFRFLDPAGPDSPAGQLAGCVQANYDDVEAVKRFADGVDAVTYEFENVPVEPLEALGSSGSIAPPLSALAVAQDRLHEKQMLQQLGIATPKFAGVAMRAELDAAVGFLGTPSILKTRRFGYDGRGQATLRSASDAEQAVAVDRRTARDSRAAHRVRRGGVHYRRSQQARGRRVLSFGAQHAQRRNPARLLGRSDRHLSREHPAHAASALGDQCDLSLGTTMWECLLWSCSFAKGKSWLTRSRRVSTTPATGA